MKWWRRVQMRLKRGHTSTSRTRDGRVVVHSPRRFKPLPMSDHQYINDVVEAECRGQFQAYLQTCGRTMDTLADVEARSRNLGAVINSVSGPGTLVERVADAMGYRDFFNGGAGPARAGISNMTWQTGVNGQDPARNNRAAPNLYISPGEAATIYSQGGLPKVIIEKKAKTMLNNGVQIKNSRLTDEQIEKINENMIKTGLAKAISDALRDSLTYSGALLMPFFRTDNPLTMTLPVPQLVQYGVIKKDCIERWCVLDRWNTVHFPNWNPLSTEFHKPRYFYIPFLGTDVHSTRLARVVTAPQPGYWGVMLNMGWGVSDIPSWIEAVFNYYNVMQAIPTMIQQMSLLARTFNVDGPMAMEGGMILDQMADETTMRVREASPLNPVNLDVVGKLEAIQRDFAEVPELTRLIRQDLAAKAGFLEQALFTVEKKGMGGGNDKGQSSWARQEESNRFIYADVQQQLKPIAMLQIINALGTGRDVLKALPYTQITFDQQMVVEVEDRKDILAASTKGLFDLAAAGVPLDMSMQLIQQMSANLLRVNTPLLKELEERQKLIDEMDQEKHKAEIEAAHAAAAAPAVGGSSSAKDKKGHSYNDPKEQKSKEVVGKHVGGTRKVGVQRARNKKVN